MLAAQHLVWVWLALAIAVVTLAIAWRFRSRSRRFLLAGILLPSTSAISIALALSGLSLAARPRVTLLLDFSASARTSRWHDPSWVQTLARRRLSSSQPLTVIAFAGTERHILIPDITPAGLWPAQFTWDPSPTASTDLDAVLASVPTEPPSVRWIITDGLFPSSAIPARLDRTAFTILPPTAPDAAVRDFVLQPAGEQLAISVQLAVSGIPKPATARVTVERDGTTLTDQLVEFRPAPQIENQKSRIENSATVRWLTLRDPSPPSAPAHYTALIQLPGDFWPENDRASAVWPGPADQRILIVGTTRPADLPGTFIPTDRFPTDPTQLAAEGWQTIVLNDVPAEPQPNTPALSPAAARALDRVVRDYGTGLLILGDVHAFGPGRYGEGSLPGDLLEALSPVSSHPQQSGGLNVLFLLDASSSMNEIAPNTTERKFSVLSRAVQQAAAGLADNDALTLVTFNSTSRLLAIGTARDARPRLAPQLAAVQPSGSTTPDTAFPRLAEFLQLSGRHLVILLTDGEIPALNVPRWQRLLQNPDAHLVIIAPPPSGSVAPLRELAATVSQSSWSQTTDSAAWADALRNAILDQTRGTVQSAPLPWHTTDNSLSATAPAWTQTWLKPEATLLAASIDHWPRATDQFVSVAALAQRGLGKVAALTVAPDTSPPYRALRRRLLDAVAAPPGDRRFTAAAQHTVEGWLITVDAIDAGEFINGQKLLLKSLISEGTVPLQQTAPGHYETRVSSAPEGLAAVIVRQSPAGELVARLQTPAVATAEYPATVQNVASLPPGTTVLPVNNGLLWTPPAASFSLTSWLFLLAAVNVVVALWLRH
jgi:hypothetical protein